MSESRATSFLQMIRRSQRGRLKIYLGFAPGVGKTYQMLQEAHRLKAEGVDVVIGVVEHHERPDTRQLIEGLERVPMRQVEYHGITVEEIDVDAVLARRPQVVLVDELAHTNVPGSRNGKRYEDVRDLVAAGVHVLSTMNVQHLESLYDTVERLLGVKVRERIPDAVLAEADQVVNVDLAAEDLQKRMREGKVYPKDRIATSLSNFFTESNLEHLRELTLRELASQLDSRRRELRSTGVGDGSADTASLDTDPDQVMVCLSSRGPNSAKLLRFGSRLAGRLNRNWYAVYVQTPSEEPTVIDSGTQRLLADTLTLANQLGAMVFTFKGADVSDTILRFAKEYRVGNIVIGSPHQLPWWQRLLGKRSVAEQLIIRQKDVTVIVVDADAREPEPQVTLTTAADPSTRTNQSSTVASDGNFGITTLLNEQGVIVFNDPVTKAHVLSALVDLVSHVHALDTTDVLNRVMERESQGSTFLNEGVALPHARIPGLPTAIAAIGITRGGLLDVNTDTPVTAVFVLLTPAEGASIHLAALASAGRLLNNRIVRQQLATATTPSDVMNVLRSASSL